MDLNSPEEEDFPGRLLHQAALWDNAELLEDLLKGDQRRHLDGQDSWGRTPLHAAATSENSRCLRVLLQCGANPNIPCGPRGDNRTPLHLCAEYGFINNIMLLLAHKADLLAEDGCGLTPLSIAEKGEHVECVTILKQAVDARELSRHAVHLELREAVSNGDYAAIKARLAELGKETEAIVNMAPNGSNTLLFIASEMGRKDIVKLLLEHDADGRIHPVTRYSPLYIACFKQCKEVVDILLKKFPELVQQCTVEKWLPIHAACINNSVQIMETLLKFPYPKDLLTTYRDGDWEFTLPFDINMKDVTGQNVLYLASFLGNSKMVEILLKFRVKAVRIKDVNEDKEALSSDTKNSEQTSPSRRRISDGIQSIMSRLNLSSRNSGNADSNERYLSPLKLNMYCNNGAETALHAAVRLKHNEIASALLSSGANPNLPALHNVSDQGALSQNEDNTTPLVEACRNRDLTMVDLLLKHGARDDDCKALSVVVGNKDDILTAKLLSIKAFPDPEHRINKKSMSENLPAMQFGGITGLTYSSLFADTPVMINWHCQKCQLSKIKPQWLVDAALRVNPKLRLNPKSKEVVLYAITRLDISNNTLNWIPPVIFQLQSLRYLNLAQNKIERLPLISDFERVYTQERSSKKLSRPRHPVIGYSVPLLEELFLQDNRLELIPDEIFKLPSLVTLDVSNNKLHTLPYQVWRAPKLKELNVAFNLLKDLPSVPPEEAANSDTGSIGSIDSSKSFDSGLESHLTEPSDTPRHQNTEHLDLIHHTLWVQNIEITEQIIHTEDENSSQENSSQLSALNLSHNQFTSIPPVLPCLAVNLTRLNMAYNNLRSMGYITSYPSSLKQLDLSNNKVCVWPSLPQPDLLPDSSEITCYALDSSLNKSTSTKIFNGRRSQNLRTSVLNSVCPHRCHLRLDSLRTLILADNALTRIQLCTDDDGSNISSTQGEDQESDWDFVNMNSDTCPLTLKSRLIFPNISMLDLSNNQLKRIPASIYKLSNLSVLNVAGNTEISDLPPQMGLLSRLWSFNTRGCNLQGPLKAMIESNAYKTMDVIGYLKSILEDAQPYARMKLMIVGIQGIGKTSLLEQLRQEGTGSYKKKPVEHWAKRMGNKNINVKNSRGTNLSTVGVDINDWSYEKRVRGQSTHGPVTFRTWDFGGQREYYATHQYFLSKRSLYLVVWKIPDGQKGISEILQWLVNIQARAPNSPVIIIGTHYDMMRENYPSARSEDLQQYIRDKFINIVDAEKCGLPRVIDTIEVSCKTRHNIKLLCNLIYDTVFSLKPPGSKELLLEQKVPASYIALEDVITHLVSERRANNADPVLNAEQYKSTVSMEMQKLCNKSFRDAAELHQATLFLHENGVLLHYDDATLKDLYFLDPQWLCDMLAHVVTIREINPFARTGVMKLDDLKHVFKSSQLGIAEGRSYIVSLLNKFEVALTWDSRTLLIPSLLPTEQDHLSSFNPSVRIPIRSRGWAIRTKKPPSTSTTAVGNSLFYSSVSVEQPAPICEEPIPELSHRSDPEVSIRRLLLMSYFPSGFWSRLITRVLADDSIVEIVRSFFIIPKEVSQDAKLAQLLDVKVEWVLWQTGMELRYSDLVLFRMKEILPGLKSAPVDYRTLKMKLKQEGIWNSVDVANSSILEVYMPLDTIVIKRPIMDQNEPTETIGYHALVLDPSPEYSAQLLAVTIDHIDVLLEDWYPTLGTRFVHTSEGKFLVTRLVPCPHCIASTLVSELDISGPSPGDSDAASKKILEGQSVEPFGLFDAEQSNGENWPVRKSQESYTSDVDSGVGPDSPGSSRKPSVEGHPCLNGDEEEDINKVEYCWMVEECILAAYDKKIIKCPNHGDIPLAQVAPDTMFLDLGERYLIRPQNIVRGPLLGRGAFGFVFKGSCKVRGTNTSIDVAMKMLQPVQPGPNASKSAFIAFKGAQGKWERDPLQYASKAYCTARQELNILMNLRHPNIVPLVGVCARPLAIVLDLAPLGALDATLRHYRRSGAKLEPYTLQAVILQVAKAMEYLHQQHIIYRDLKSENVLVWSIPQPFQSSFEVPVHLKLADYGISRLTLPSGTKGFGGTEGFMAPEIMRFNGEEEYTEKVDCFSFGMFIYELLSLHQPFENHESVKDCILEGGRPPLSHKETLYPCYMLDLMVLCWAQGPRDRPSASQIVSIASAPEFAHLYDVTSLSHPSSVVSAVSAVFSNSNEEENEVTAEVWLACANSKIDQLTANEKSWQQYTSLSLPECPTAMCLVENSVWFGDVKGQIHAFAAYSCQHLFSYNLLPEAESKTAGVCAILTMPSQDRVAVGLTNGRIFLVRSDILPATSSMGEGSFVMSELGSTTVLHTLTALFMDDGLICELWCGGSDGCISVYTMQENIVSGHEVLNHFEPLQPNVNVLKLVSSHSPVMHSGQTSVWSYVYPGCAVYQWNPETRSIVNKLDCSKLVPCSESLQSISIEEHLSPGRCQVTSLCVMENELYIGTTWGCIVVAERDSMRPITVFRPFEEEVYAIIALPSFSSDSTSTLVTIGRGYRNLIKRYKDIVGMPTMSGQVTNNDSSTDNTFGLLWVAKNWTAA
nr:PREDICTED: leucine-rich repeat serine/threonine-protein kinase 1 isoform X2 [Bemisia tabaci]